MVGCSLYLVFRIGTGYAVWQLLSPLNPIFNSLNKLNHNVVAEQERTHHGLVKINAAVDPEDRYDGRLSLEKEIESLRQTRFACLTLGRILTLRAAVLMAHLSCCVGL